MKSIFHQFLCIIAIACMAIVATSDDSTKSISVVDSVQAQDSVKVAKKKPIRYIQPRPERISSRAMDGIKYTSGRIGLESEADTLLLIPFKFRNFHFLRKSSYYGVYYHAWWPRDLELDSLPPQFFYLEYDRVTEPQLNESAHAIEADTAKKPTIEKSRRRIKPPPEDHPFTRRWGGRYYTSCWVIIESDQDTTLLRELGFRKIWIAKRNPASVQCGALVPKDLPWDSLPPQIINMSYPMIDVKPKTDSPEKTAN
ncbi:hypothetical protein KKG05_09910 [bacterium]|nr:hypothetical protein [bacterium]